MRGGGRSVTSRALFNLLSQSINTGGNLLLAVVVARVTTASEFGAWAVSYVGYVVALSFTRSIASMPMTLEKVSSDAKAEARTVRGAASAAAMTGVVGALLLVLVGALFEPGRVTFWAFALVLPGLLAQDATRYAFFRDRRPHLAAVSDALWLALQSAAFIGLEITDRATPAASSIAWGMAGGAGAVMSLLVLRTGISARAGAGFLRQHWWVSSRLMVDAVLVTVSTHALPVVTASVAGLAAAGALRAAQTVMGGVSLVTAGLTPTMTVESVRVLSEGGRETSLLWRWCLIIATTAGLYGVLVLLLPDTVGKQLLGSNWLAAEPLLLALIVQAVIRGPFTGVPILLRATRRLNDALRLRVQTCVPALALPSAGAFYWGASGAAWGIALSAAVIDVQCLLVQRRTGRPAPSTSGADPSDIAEL